MPIGYGAGLTYTVAEGMLDDKPVGVSLNLNFMQRRLHGDGANAEYDTQRERVLGTSKRNFSGYEAGLNLQYAKLTGAIAFYSFPRAEHVPGFSRGQVTAGFALKADLVSKELK